MQSFTKDRGNVIDSAPIGTLNLRIFSTPISDTSFTEQFTTAMTLIGV